VVSGREKKTLLSFLSSFCLEGASGKEGRKEAAARAQKVRFKYLDEDDARSRPLDSDEENRTKNNRTSMTSR
jgi:hypothetical protein